MSVNVLKEYFFRHFMGRVKVRSHTLRLEISQTSPLRRPVSVHPIQTVTRVLSANLFSVDNICCVSRGGVFSPLNVSVRGDKITCYAPREISVRSMRSFKVTVADDLKKILLLPQERENRLRWQTKPPKQSMEVALAYFAPVIQEAILKVTLNKQRGTLLIWYNPDSRHFRPGGLYLYRRFGVAEKPEWRWCNL